MKKTGKKIMSLLLVLVIAMTLIGASASVSFAAAPGVIRYCGDMWIWPGQGRDAWVITDLPATAVKLERRTTGSWQTYRTCTKDSSGRYWNCVIQTAYTDLGSEWEFRFALTNSDGTAYSPVFTVRATQDSQIARVAGPNRYETAFLTADLFKEITAEGKFNNVIIACGTDFADALGGTYLSALYEAPILLVSRSSSVMDSVAAKAAEGLAAGGKVFILGGTGAVPVYMESALAAKGIDGSRVRRFAGKNRYDTNLQILKYCDLSSEEIMVCCGTDFADALSASALGYPVLLVGKDLNDDQKAYLKTLSPYYVNLVGGTGAVSQGIEDWLDTNYFHIWRYAGADRYETSYMLAYDYIYYQSYYVFLAYSRNFPDGLAAGPLAYMLGAPLLLVNDSNYKLAAQFIDENQCRDWVVMGGPALISDETIKKIEDLADPNAGVSAFDRRGAEGSPEWSKR